MIRDGFIESKHLGLPHAWVVFMGCIIMDTWPLEMLSSAASMQMYQCNSPSCSSERPHEWRLSHSCELCKL